MLKRTISALLVFTMLTAVFTIAPSAATKASENVAATLENAVGADSTAYGISKITIEGWNSCAKVTYVAASDCYVTIGMYDPATKRLLCSKKQAVSANDGNTEIEVECDFYSSYSYDVKAFMVSDSNAPLSKKYETQVKYDEWTAMPSVWFQDETMPTRDLPQTDDGIADYGNGWSLDKDGKLKIDENFSLYDNGFVLTLPPWHYYRTNIKSVEIAEGVEYIYKNSFMGLSGVTEIKLPSTLTYIYDNAFDGMSSLIKINIPANVSGIGNGVFKDCSSLKEFTVDSQNTRYYAVDGVLYGSNGYYNDDYNYRTGIALIAFPENKSTSFTVPKDVVEIHYGAFNGNDKIVSVTLPDSLTTINIEAFKNCTSLEKINLPEGLNYIYTGAFNGCKNIKTVTIPNSIFDVTDCFSGMENLEEVNISANVEYIDNRTFVNCKSLKRINVAEDNKDYCSVDGVLFSKDMSTIIACPNAKSGSYVIPNSPTTICSDAFNGCSLLKYITIPDSVEYIYDYAFKNCSSLTDIKLPDSVTSISKEMFTGCSSLTSIYIPASVTYIPMYLLNNDEYSSTFSFCKNLKNIEVSEENENYCSVDGVLYDKNQTTLIAYPSAKGTEFKVPYGVERIGSTAFAGTDIEKIEIADSVNYVGQGAFAKCENLTSVKWSTSADYIYSSTFSFCKSLKKFTIPENVTGIGELAFRDCTSIETITIPSSVTHMSYLTFTGCNNLKSIYFQGKAPYYDANCTFMYNSELTVYYPDGYSEWDYSRMIMPSHNCVKWVSYEYGLDHPTIGTHTFTGLKPNTDYIVAMVNDCVETDFLADNNLEYIDQLTSDVNGKITMNYAFKNCNFRPEPVAMIFGTSDYELTFDTVKVTANDYNGDYQRPIVTYNGKVLTEGTDYVSALDNEYWDIGDYRISISGMGNYYGSLAVDYTVNLPADVCYLEDAVVTVTANKYNGDWQNADITVKYNGKVLTEGVDYIRWYGDNYRIPGEYTLCINGYGKFYGKAFADYTVTSDAKAGDADGNGIIDVCDVTIIQRYLADGYNEDYMEKILDANGDGSVTVDDATFIQQKLLELD